MKCRRVGRISSVPLDEKNDEERKDFGREKKKIVERTHTRKTIILVEKQNGGRRKTDE